MFSKNQNRENLKKNQAIKIEAVRKYILSKSFAVSAVRSMHVMIVRQDQAFFIFYQTSYNSSPLLLITC